jgi:hypothetical protein
MGRRRGCRALGLLKVAVLAFGVLGLACEHDPASQSPPEAEGRARVAARLLKIELDARLLRRRADDPTLAHYTARLDAIDALLAHIAVTTRYLAEDRRRAAEVGTDVAGVTFDLMRADLEATVRHSGGVIRSDCNKGLEWAGIGIQGLAVGPDWADRTSEVAQALARASFHRDNVVRAAPIVEVMKAGVAAASITSAAASVFSLARSGLAVLARLSAWMESGGAAFGVLQAAPEGGAAIQMVTSAGALTLTHAEVMILVNAGQLSATAAALHMMASGQPPKLPQQAKAFEQWASKLPARPTPATSPEGKYEVAKTGPLNHQVQGSGHDPIWADGLRASDGHVLEAKHVGDATISPYVDGSSCPDAIRAKVLEKLMFEFERYAAVVRDTSNPVVGLEVIVSDAKAVPLFERLMAQFSIPGQVVVSPP